MDDKTLALLGDRAAADMMAPAHIDREEWTAEWTVDEFGHKCSKCGEYLPDGEIDWKPQFCPWCGRPLTPEAWAELEKRVRGRGSELPRV